MTILLTVHQHMIKNDGHYHHHNVLMNKLKSYVEKQTVRQ